jgi:hypothetical protein
MAGEIGVTSRVLLVYLINVVFLRTYRRSCRCGSSFAPCSAISEFHVLNWTPPRARTRVFFCHAGRYVITALR